MNSLWANLLKSVEGGHKYLSLGRSPVQAIDEAFKMEKEGLIKLVEPDINVHGWEVIITDKGKKYITGSLI